MILGFVADEIQHMVSIDTAPRSAHKPGADRSSQNRPLHA
jgi:hypothetical protein